MGEHTLLVKGSIWGKLAVYEENIFCSTKAVYGGKHILLD